jgi:hypothetical protein
MNGEGLTDDDRARIEAFLSKPPYERDFSDLIPSDDEAPGEEDDPVDDGSPTDQPAANDPERERGVRDVSAGRDRVQRWRPY